MCPQCARIRLGEIAAFVEDRFIARFGKRVGEAIAEIESCRMLTAAVGFDGKARPAELVGIEVNNLERPPRHKDVQPGRAVTSVLLTHHD